MNLYFDKLFGSVTFSLYSLCPLVFEKVNTHESRNYSHKTAKNCKELTDFPGWSYATEWWPRVFVVPIIARVIIVTVSIIICYTVI